MVLPAAYRCEYRHDLRIVRMVQRHRALPSPAGGRAGGGGEAADRPNGGQGGCHNRPEGEPADRGLLQPRRCQLPYPRGLGRAGGAQLSCLSHLEVEGTLWHSCHRREGRRPAGAAGGPLQHLHLQSWPGVHERGRLYGRRLHRHGDRPLADQGDHAHPTGQPVRGHRARGLR